MTQSFYVEKHCIDPSELKPWFLVLIGAVVQSIITTIITLNATTSSNSQNDLELPLNGLNKNNDDKTSEKMTCLKRIKNSKCFTRFQTLLFIWQCISVIGILITDTFAIIDKASNFDSPWIRYQCSAAILLNSSNAKTFIFYGSLLTMFDMDELKQTATIKFQRRKWIFIYIIGCIGFIYLTSLIVFTYPAFFTYIWLCAATAGPVAIIVICFRVCCKGDKCGRDGYNIFENQYHLYVVLPMIAVYVIVSSMAMINLYSGISYKNSIMFVLTERHWITYWTHVKSNTVAKFRFITLIL